MINADWYAKSAPDVIRAFDSDERGLTRDEAARRLKEFGPNKLPEQKGKSLFAIFFEQFKSPLIYVLIIADVIVFFLKELADGFIILFILLFNAVLGTVQEGRAQNTLSKLAKFVETRAEVIRNGQEFDVPDTDVVPGDIIALQEGEKVPADARLIEARNLKTEEAALTGESEPVRKFADPIMSAGLQTAEQKNMVFKGTTVAVGAGTAVVTATGLNTVMGKISKAMSEIDTDMPLAKNLDQLARIVVIIVTALIAIIFTLGVAEGKDPKEMFIAAVAIAVAAVPEGLPLVLTVTLAAGVWRMAKKKVLVKKLQAVEALGQAQKIAVDKTGTITKNELVIQKVLVGGNEYDIAGVGYDPNPQIGNPSAELVLSARIAACCSNAQISFSLENNLYKIIGDPTEGALSIFAAKTGLSREKFLASNHLIQDWPFDYQKKFHAAIYENSGRRFFAITGAPEIIFGLCKKYLKNGSETILDPASRSRFEQRFIGLSQEGLRVIAFAFANEPPINANQDSLPELTLGGLFSMRDGLRPGIKESVEKARLADIKTILITGDHAVTAETIARQAGIYKTGDLILTGQDIDTMPTETLAAKLEMVTVFARVTPEHKMKIIESYRKRGEVIAMTGDGVNDAPSLVAADLGIAMGKIGTEVAKEASDLVLLEDNFGDILNAVEEGRNMRQGLRRAITYLFSSNLGEVLVIIFALIARFPLPLIAAQLIWMNVVTDTFFDISLAMEPKDPVLMKKGARIHRKLFDGFLAHRLAIIAPVIALGSFWLFHDQIGDPVRARTFALTGLVIFQWFNALNCRSEEKSIFKMNPFSNKFLTMTLGWVAILHVFAIYSPFMNKILRISPLHPKDWLEIIAVASTVLIIEEIRKLFYRRRLQLSLA